jgi:hypothetical protein
MQNNTSKPGASMTTPIVHVGRCRSGLVWTWCGEVEWFPTLELRQPVVEQHSWRTAWKNLLQKIF